MGTKPDPSTYPPHSSPHTPIPPPKIAPPPSAVQFPPRELSQPLQGRETPDSPLLSSMEIDIIFSADDTGEGLDTYQVKNHDAFNKISFILKLNSPSFIPIGPSLVPEEFVGFFQILLEKGAARIKVSDYSRAMLIGLMRGVGLIVAKSTNERQMTLKVISQIELQQYMTQAQNPKLIVMLVPSFLKFLKIPSLLQSDSKSDLGHHQVFESEVYKPENICGFTGNFAYFPSVYFRFQNSYGRIVQMHQNKNAVGRVRTLQTDAYFSFLSSPPDQKLIEISTTFSEELILHISRNSFQPVTRESIEILSRALGQYQFQAGSPQMLQCLRKSGDCWICL